MVRRLTSTTCLEHDDVESHTPASCGQLLFHSIHLCVHVVWVAGRGHLPPAASLRWNAWRRTSTGVLPPWVPPSAGKKGSEPRSNRQRLLLRLPGHHRGTWRQRGEPCGDRR